MNYKKTAGVHHGNWQFPVISQDDLVEQTESLVEFIDNHREDFDIEEYGEDIKELSERLDFLLSQVVPQLGGQTQAIPNYYLGLQQIKEILISILPPLQVNRLSRHVTSQKARIRSIESRLNEVEPRADDLERKIERIEAAHDAADQLPATLEDLEEAKDKISKALSKAQTEETNISTISGVVEKLKITIEETSEDAKKTLQKCESALRSSTSVGLAAAFYERSAELKSSIRIWLIALVASLIGAIYLGYLQLGRLATLIEHPDAPTAIIVMNLLTSMVSIGACIWLAWLSTKQIGHRFRLSEDYAFKASISRAYEGYRSEAARIDQDLEVQLLASALSRLDELPLRLVETSTHGSPWSELLNSESVKSAMKTVPNFVESVKSLAIEHLSRHRSPGKNGDTESADGSKQPTKQTDSD